MQDNKPDPSKTYYGFCCTKCGFEQIMCPISSLKELKRDIRQGLYGCNCTPINKKFEPVIVTRKREDVPSCIGEYSEYFCWKCD